MKNHHLLLHLFLLLLLFFVTSSNAQNNTVTIGQPKIVIPTSTDPHLSFRCSMKDRTGNLWFGTTGIGIYRYDGKYFTHFSEKEGIANQIIYSIIEDKTGSIWIGTDKGVFRREGKTFNYFEIPFVSTVYSILEDNAGNIWFGTENTGLWRYDGKSLTDFQFVDSSWKIIPTDSVDYYKKINRGFIQYMTLGKNGKIWFSAVGYPSLNSYDGHIFKQITDENKKPGHIFYMIEDKVGNLWCATRDNGVCRYSQNSVTYYNKNEGLLDNANSLLEDNKGHIWIGSRGKLYDNGGRIMKYDGKSFSQVATDSLMNNHIWSLIEDNTGNIWIGTQDLGLYRYDGRSFTDLVERGK